MTAAELLDRQPHPTDAQIKEALSDLICRCGTHGAALRAVSAPRGNLRRRAMTSHEIDTSSAEPAAHSSLSSRRSDVTLPRLGNGPRPHNGAAARPAGSGDQLDFLHHHRCRRHGRAYYADRRRPGSETAIAQMVAEEIDSLRAGAAWSWRQRAHPRHGGAKARPSASRTAA